MTIYAGLKALHLLCAVLWVGGMFLHTRVFRRFFLVIWHAMPIAIISGFAMVGLQWNMATAPWQLNAMMGLGLIMGAVFLAIFFGPYREFRRTIDRNRMASSLDNIRKLIGVNLILGLVTIIVAGLL